MKGGKFIVQGWLSLSKVRSPNSIGRWGNLTAKRQSRPWIPFLRPTDKGQHDDDGRAFRAETAQGETSLSLS